MPDNKTPNERAAEILTVVFMQNTRLEPEQTLKNILQSEEGKKIDPATLKVIQSIMGNEDAKKAVYEATYNARDRGIQFPSGEINEPIPPEAQPVLQSVTTLIDSYQPATAAKPKSLTEMIAREYHADIAMVDNVGNFNYAAEDFKRMGETGKQDINADTAAGVEFRNGNYNVGTHTEILQGMETFGRDIIAMAKRQGAEIKDLVEFKNADYNRDGKVDAKEVGATVVAASMRTTTTNGEVVSTFDNTIESSLSSLSPEARKAVGEIAQQLLGDNKITGFKDTGSKEADAQFVNAVKDKTSGIGF